MCGCTFFLSICKTLLFQSWLYSHYWTLIATLLRGCPLCLLSNRSQLWFFLEIPWLKLMSRLLWEFRRVLVWKIDALWSLIGNGVIEFYLFGLFLTWSLLRSIFWFLFCRDRRFLRRKWWLILIKFYGPSFRRIRDVWLFCCTWWRL